MRARPQKGHNDENQENKNTKRTQRNMSGHSRDVSNQSLIHCSAGAAGAVGGGFKGVLDEPLMYCSAAAGGWHKDVRSPS